MSTTTAPDRRTGHRFGRVLLGLTVTSAVVLTATTAMATTVGHPGDPGPLAGRPQPPRVPTVHGAPLPRPAATQVPATTSPKPSLPAATGPTGHSAAAAPAASATAAPAPTPTAAPAEAPAPSTAPVPEQSPVSAPPTTIAAVPTTVAPTTTAAPARCVITYSLDGVSPDIARAAFAAIEAQVGVRFEAAQDAPTVQIRSYWPADNPTAAFGWTGPVHGQMSIYLKPILERTPDFARLMLVHELGHVLGLGHTQSGTPMDDMPGTDTFTAEQMAQMVLPC